MATWVRRWGLWISDQPVRPGVWRRRDGGHVIRGRATDPRTGKVREVLRSLHDAGAGAAAAALAATLDAIRAGGSSAPRPRTRFSEFAASLFERKVQAGDIKSAKGREKWCYILEHHLLPAFGEVYLDRLHPGEVQAWRAQVGAAIAAGDYSPHTANDWLRVLRVIMRAARIEHQLATDPLEGVEDFDASAHATYSDEEPNALLVEEVPPFLAALRARWPQHYAMVALGFATGLRPSTLRPLRRCGATPDVLWDEGVLLVRRSQTMRDEVMATTKTKRHQRLALPSALVDVLRWHVEYQLPDATPPACELLFPSEVGGYRSRSCLDKPFADVATHLALGKRITPRAMRRTFQDLARAAEVRDLVTRAVSGHATEQMQRHYSSVSGEEMRAGLAKVIDLAGFKQASGS